MFINKMLLYFMDNENNLFTLLLVNMNEKLKSMFNFVEIIYYKSVQSLLGFI